MRLLRPLIERDAAGSVEREQHQPANDGERLEKVVAVKVDESPLHRPEWIPEGEGVAVCVCGGGGGGEGVGG